MKNLVPATEDKNVWIAVHRYNTSGWADDDQTDTYFFRSIDKPTIEQVAKALSIDFEPEKGDELDFERVGLTQVVDLDAPKS